MIVLWVSRRTRPRADARPGGCQGYTAGGAVPKSITGSAGLSPPPTGRLTTFAIATLVKTGQRLSS